MRPNQVRARLLDYARAHRLEPQSVFNDFARERFVARLATHLFLPQHVLLKGGFLLQSLIGLDTFRPTHDLDLGLFREPVRPDMALMVDEPDQQRLTWPVERIVATIARIDLQDGLVFVFEGLQAQPIRDRQRYGGMRVPVRGDLAGARVHFVVDVGEGDVVTPRPEAIRVPMMLDGLSMSSVLGVSLETVVAEKLDALIELGVANTRLKDYFDLWLLASRQSFDLRTLANACRRTRTRRGRSPLDGQPDGLSLTFVARNSGTWRARWTGRQDAPELAEVIARISAFVTPILAALTNDSTTFGIGSWRAGGPWLEGR